MNNCVCGSLKRVSSCTADVRDVVCLTAAQAEEEAPDSYFTSDTTGTMLQNGSCNGLLI